VVNPDRKNFVIYRKDEEKLSDKYMGWVITFFCSKVQEVKEEGLYFFGGQTQKYDQLGDLLILKTDQRPMYWLKVDTKGKSISNRRGDNFIKLLVMTILWSIVLVLGFLSFTEVVLIGYI
jgi:hypothetical protein